MKVPVPFEYVKARSLQDIFEAFKRFRSPFVISGGTVGVLMLKNRVVRPDAVLDVSEIPELNQLSVSENEVFVGSGIKLYKLKHLLPQDPASELVIKSAESVGDLAIRSMGSVGGNVCLGDPSNDLPVAFTAIRARAVVVNENEKREVYVKDFYKGPFRTVLERGEILLGVKYSRLFGYRTSYNKHFIRFLDHYVAMVAAAAKLSEDRIEDLRFAVAGEAVGMPVLLELGSFELDELDAAKEMIQSFSNSLKTKSNRFGTEGYKKKVVYTLMNKSLEEVVKR